VLLTASLVVGADIGYVLTYEAERGPDEPPLNMRALVDALNRRLGDRAVSKAKGERSVEVLISGKPGKEEIQRNKSLVAAPGTLEFRIVAHQRGHEEIMKMAHLLKPDEKVVKIDDGEVAHWVPVRAIKGEKGEVLDDRSLDLDWQWSKDKPEEIANRQGLATRTVTDADGKTKRREILLYRDGYHIGDKFLTKAASATDERGGTAIDLEFDREGTKRFAELTTKFAPPEGGAPFRWHVAIVVDGIVHSAPRLNAAIAGGKAQVTFPLGPDGRTERDRVLAALIAGRLPCKVRLTGESEPKPAGKSAEPAPKPKD
jgi:preprotein translocase subunit SecD